MSALRQVQYQGHWKEKAQAQAYAKRKNAKARTKKYTVVPERTGGYTIRTSAKSWKGW